MFDGRLPQAFIVPLPSDDPTLTEDDEPLEETAAEAFGIPDEGAAVEDWP
jgi:hypothetical protein